MKSTALLVLAQPSCWPVRYVLLILASLFLLIPNAGFARSSAPPLFAEAADLGHGIDPTLEADVYRFRFVDVDTRLVESAVGPHQQGPETLVLNLFDDLTLEAVLLRIEHNRSGSLTWIGTVDGDPMSSVTLVTKEAITVGSIRADGALYLLQYAGGPHVILDVDQNSPRYKEAPPTAIDPSLPNVTDAGSLSEVFSGGAPPAEDDGSTQDLMVVYTAQAVALQGSVIAMENLIDLGVSETNQSYANSDIAHRIRLVHTQQVDYTESGDVATDRNRLRIPSDGFMDEVHAWRDAKGADLTKLIVSGGGCGIAYIMTTVSTSFENFAFCVTSVGCVSPNYTFAHELGHIQSARHDYTVDPTTNSPFAFNHGYFPPTNQWRTVMSYSNGCSGCQRQLYWSNPDIKHPVTGHPLGIPDGQPQAADNHLTLNTTAWTVANFRIAPLFVDGFETGNTSAWNPVP